MSTHTAVILLCYNGESHLRTFLPSVLQYSPEAEVIVVDNASTDGSVEYLRQHHPDVRLILHSTNHGFAQGYHLALQQIEARYYLLLNTDVAPAKGWLTPLINMMDEDENVGAVQPKVRSYDRPESFEHAGAAGGHLDMWGYPFCRGRLFENVEHDTGQYDSAQSVHWVSGCAMMIRAEVYHDAGGVDGDFFAHMEEIDLCCRLLRRGYTLLCEPRSVVYHLGGGTLAYHSPRKTYLNFRNNLYLISKNFPLPTLLWLLPLRWALDMAAGLRLSIHQSPAHLWAICRAYLHFMKTLPHTLRKRQKLPHTLRLYPHSVVWQHFVRKKQKYSELP